MRYPWGRQYKIVLVLLITAGVVSCIPISKVTLSSSGKASALATNSGAGGDTSVGIGAACGSANTISAASFYPCSIYFNQSVKNAAKDPHSAAILSALLASGRWGGAVGAPRDFGITGLNLLNDGDTGIDVYYTNDSVALPTEIPFNVTSLDANSDPLPTVPVPSGLSTKGFEDGNIACATGGDCHYIVMDLRNGWEYDAYQASYASNLFSATSTALWPFRPSGGWHATGRGEGCTSADATGLPIAPLLFSVEELAAGQINHALRFILDNGQIAHMAYVFPGTHTTGAASATAGIPATPGAPGYGMPYGAWLRLRADYPIASLPSKGAQIVATALQNYGMILADGGHITLTAKSDSYSSIKYSAFFSTSNDLAGLAPSDFDVIAPPGAPSGGASTIASQPTVLAGLTCNRDINYSYLNGVSLATVPASTHTAWINSLGQDRTLYSCSSLGTLADWLNCQISQGNN